MSFKPSLSKRQKALTTRLQAPRSKWVEKRDLEAIQEYGISVNFFNRLGYLNGVVTHKLNESDLYLLFDDGIRVKIGGQIFDFQSELGFELWLIRRIQRAKQLKDVQLKDKLLGIYSLFLSLELEERWR